MDEFNHQSIQTPRQFSKSRYKKKALQFILTVSLMSFVFSYTLPLPFLLHSFNVYLSTFSMQLDSCTIDRKYMFLLCNGILVLIVTSSGLIGNSPLGTDHYGEHIKNHGDGGQSVLELSMVKESVAREVAMEIEEEHGRENGFLDTEEKDRETVNWFLIKEEEERGEEVEEEEDIETVNWLLIKEEEERGEEVEEEEEDEEEEGIGSLSTEELNKKCDEFIKRMKEGIKTESQQLIKRFKTEAQQLIMV